MKKLSNTRIKAISTKLANAVQEDMLSYESDKSQTELRAMAYAKTMAFESPNSVGEVGNLEFVFGQENACLIAGATCDIIYGAFGTLSSSEAL